jgi:uncharacterized BrkB/YihY/UPF0761 family membrane protein
LRKTLLVSTSQHNYAGNGRLSVEAASAFGAAASFAVLLIWLYYTAQIFLFGAEFTACLGGLHERRSSAPARTYAN